MRALAALLILLSPLSLEAQGAARMPDVVEFEQTFPVTKTNSGISAAGNVDFVPHGATARDSDYPNIGLTDEIKVVSDGARNVVDANTNYANAGLVVDRGLGAVVGSGNYPTYIDANRRLKYRAEYHITTASLVANTFAPVLGLHVTAGGARLLRLDLTPSGGNWLATFGSELWNEGDINAGTETIATADLQDKRIAFQFDLTPGTMDAPGDNVEDDGSLVVSMIDLDSNVETVLYTFTNRSFYLSWAGRNLGGGSTVPQNNALAVMSAGYAGLIGKLERLAILSPGGAPAMPEPGSLVDHSEPCCDAGAGGGTSAGPVLEPVNGDWTPSLEGGGTIDDPITPEDDEDWTVQTPPKDPDSWLTIAEDPYPTASPSDARLTKWGLKPLSDAGRLVEARLREVGAIERPSSDKHGNYAPARARFVVDDADGSIRERLGDARRRFLLHREARYELASYAGRKAGLEPMPCIQGRIVDVQPALDRQAIVELQDIVGSQFGILNPDKMIGLFIGDEHENLPDETRGAIYHILLGEHSTRGRVDVEGNDANTGAIPARDCGDTDFEESGGSGLMVSAPRNLTANYVGSESGDEKFTYGIVGVTNFGHTVMSNVVSVSGLPKTLDKDNYVELTWDPPLTGAEHVIAYWVMGRHASTPNKRLDTMNNGGTWVDPETTYRDGRQGSRTDFDTEKTVNFKPIATAPASNTRWTWFVVALGEVPILDVCGSDLAEGGQPRRVVLDINAGDILTPESDDWPEENPYRVVGGIRQSGFWARGPRVQHHRDGIVTFACNTGGWKGTNGLLINQAFLMLYRFLNDAVEKDGGLGYRDGEFGPCQTFADGRPKFHIEKFLEAQDATVALMGASSPSLGFIGKMFVLEPTPLGEILRRFFNDFGGHLTSHRSGAVYPFVPLPTLDASAAPLFQERRQIQTLLEHSIAWDEQENRITYHFNYDADAGVFRSTDNQVQHDDSIAAHGGEQLGVFEGPPRECYFGNDAPTMLARWQTLELGLYAYAPRYVTWSTDMKYVQRDNGAAVRFAHRKEGFGSDVTGTAGVLMLSRLLVRPRAYEWQMRVRLLEGGSPS